MLIFHQQLGIFSALGNYTGVLALTNKGEKVQCVPSLQIIQLLEEVDQYITIVTRAVQDHTGKMKTNGPEGTIFSKTLSNVNILPNGLRQLQLKMHNANATYNVDLQSCLTIQVESPCILANN